jgi:hypothetical protein
MFSKEQGLNCLGGPTMFLREKEFLLPKDMIVPQEKKGLSCSQKQLKFLLPKDMIVP